MSNDPESQSPTIPDNFDKEMETALSKLGDKSVKDAFQRIANAVKKDIAADTLAMEANIANLKKRIKKIPPEQQQLLFSFIPNKLAKVSIFFPMSKSEMKEERRKIYKTILSQSKWGRVQIEGIKLSITDEDVFLALRILASQKNVLINNSRHLKFTAKEFAHIFYEGKPYSTTKLVEMLNRTLKYFQLVSFHVELFNKSKGTEESNNAAAHVGGILEAFYYFPETKTFDVHFNLHFCNLFLDPLVTGINFSLRRALSKEGSKGLLKFLSTHHEPTRMHILTVLNAINWPTDQQPMFKIRESFKEFFNDLRGFNVLGDKSKIYDDDTVYFDINKKITCIPKDARLGIK